MRSFVRLDTVLATVPSAVVAHLRTTDVGLGSEALYRHQVPSLLSELAQRARGESITASSAIEGVVVQDVERAREIIEGRARTLRSRDEQQLAGYRIALDYVFAETWAPVNVGLVLHLHRLLWSQTATTGGTFKTEDNLVVDRAADGSLAVRFRPVPKDQVEFHVAELVARYLEAGATRAHHPVLLIGLFVLDLLVVHPFQDGNGRVARILTNALLDSEGYGVGRWVSLEQIVAESADQYYASLLASTTGWHEDTADVWPWLEYFTGTVALAYQRFAARTASSRSAGSKQSRVREYVLAHAAAVFRVSDVRAALPGISDPTIRIALDGLRSEGLVVSEGTGRSATWRRVG